MEIYVSTDVEANGPIPGPYSMLSFGSAAFQADGTLVSRCPQARLAQALAAHRLYQTQPEAPASRRVIAPRERNLR